MHCLAGKVQRLEETKRTQIEEITDLSAQVLAGLTRPSMIHAHQNHSGHVSDE